MNKGLFFCTGSALVLFLGNSCVLEGSRGSIGSTRSTMSAASVPEQTKKTQARPSSSAAQGQPTSVEINNENKGSVVASRQASTATKKTTSRQASTATTNSRQGPVTPSQDYKNFIELQNFIIESEGNLASAILEYVKFSQRDFEKFFVDKKPLSPTKTNYEKVEAVMKKFTPTVVATLERIGKNTTNDLNTVKKHWNELLPIISLCFEYEGTSSIRSSLKLK